MKEVVLEQISPGNDPENMVGRRYIARLTDKGSLFIDAETCTADTEWKYAEPHASFDQSEVAKLRELLDDGDKAHYLHQLGVAQTREHELRAALRELYAHSERVGSKEWFNAIDKARALLGDESETKR